MYTYATSILCAELLLISVNLSFKDHSLLLKEEFS